MTQEEKIKELEVENDKLKEKLLDYKQLEEELMANRVFKKAKDKLVSWYTIGGIAVFAVGIIGVKSIIDYSKELVSKKLDAYSETKINEIIVGESHKQVEILIKKQQDTLSKQVQALYVDAKNRLDISKAGYGGVDIFDTAQSEINTSISQTDLSTQMSTVRDQGNEGSTVGFAIAAALEYTYNQKTKEKISISPRYIYNSINHKNDGGALFTDAFNFLSKTGAVEESVWPYKSGEFSLNAPASVDNAKHYKISNYKVLKIDATVFKNMLSNKNCILAGMTVYNSLYESKNGIYTTPKSSEQVIGGTAICIVGFDDTKQLFKFRNSWGKNWGDNGYGYFKYTDINKLITDAYIILL